MIATRLMGGLGNQMFQYAAARRLAIKHGTELVLDLSWFAKQPRGDTSRQFELDAFPVVGRPTADSLEGGRRGRRLLGSLRRANAFHRAVEQGPQFQPELLDAPDDTLLIGYWQSEKYFLDAGAQIRRDFAFEVLMGPGARALAESIDGSAVSVHVRRGDYVSRVRTHQFHGVLPIEYYERAAAAISERLRNPHFYVFSDDPDWCRANLNLPSTTTFVSRAGSTPYEDMRLMSLCRHHIIANSSFSWWGAWLSTNPEKIVIAPQAWFADDSRDTSDLVPESWTRL